MIDRAAPGGTSSTLIQSAGDEEGRGVHQLGYRGWAGWLMAGWIRWIVVAELGVLRSWQNKWLKRMLLFAWTPAIPAAFGFFLWEQAASYQEWRPVIVSLLRGLPPGPVINQVEHAIASNDYAGARHEVWAHLLLTFIRYPQAVVMVLLVGLIAPPLISQDIRSRAFLLYFSRPLSRFEYLLGKLSTLWVYLALISVVPCLVLYCMGVCLSPSLTVVTATWDIPIRIVGAAIVLMLPASSLALCLSSLSQESRNAGFAWFAIWILGWFTFGAVTFAEAFHTHDRFQRRDRMQRFDRFQNHGEQEAEQKESSWTHVSLYHTLGRVQNWVFGFSKLTDVLVSIAILLAVTLISLAILYRQISAPMRI